MMDLGFRWHRGHYLKSFNQTCMTKKNRVITETIGAIVTAIVDSK